MNQKKIEKLKLENKIKDRIITLLVQLISEKKITMPKVILESIQELYGIKNDTEK